MKKRTGHLFKRNGTFWLRYTVDGQRFAQSLKTTNKRDAQHEAERIMAPLAKADEVETLKAVQARLEDASTVAERMADEANPPPSIRQGWNLYVASETRPRSGLATLGRYEGHYNRFTRWLAGTYPEVIQLRNVDSDHASDFMRHLETLGMSGGTANKHAVFLKCFFHHVRKPAKITANPFEDIATRQHRPQSRRPLTIEELKAVIEKADGEMKTLYMVGLFSGLRLADACTLRWDEVDLARGVLRVIPNKTSRSGKGVVIGLPKIMADHLTALPRSGPYVMPGVAHDYEVDGPGLSRRIQAHLTACGIQTVKDGTGYKVVDGKEVYSGKRASVLVGFHSLRHSFVTLHAQSGTPQAVLQKLAGHANPMMTEHYVNVSDSTARSMADVLPVALLGQPTTTQREALPGWAIARLKTQTAKNWTAIRNELIKDTK